MIPQGTKVKYYILFLSSGLLEIKELHQIEALQSIKIDLISRLL
jgi:hypothetical protein